jgi:hypothetical protein
MGENIFQLYIRERIDNQNIQGAQKHIAPQNQWINKEVSKWTKQNFFKGRSPNDQNNTWKMLTIPGYKGNANQNHTNILPHSYSNGYHQEHQQQVMVRM